MEIKKISPQDLYEIRHRVLRPNQTIEDCKYPGDFDDQSFHLGAYKSSLVSIASFYNETNEHFSDASQYRLRGMATLPDHQGQGLAKGLLLNALEELKARHADVLWWNARTSAEGFYKGLGFKSFGEEFDIPGIGPHYVYMKAVDKD